MHFMMRDIQAAAENFARVHNSRPRVSPGGWGPGREASVPDTAGLLRLNLSVTEIIQSLPKDVKTLLRKIFRNGEFELE